MLVCKTTQQCLPALADGKTRFSCVGRAVQAARVARWGRQLFILQSSTLPMMAAASTDAVACRERIKPSKLGADTFASKEGHVSNSVMSCMGENEESRLTPWKNEPARLPQTLLLVEFRLGTRRERDPGEESIINSPQSQELVKKNGERCWLKLLKELLNLGEPHQSFARSKTALSTELRPALSIIVIVI